MATPKIQAPGAKPHLAAQRTEISQHTKEKADSVKSFIEGKYKKLKSDEKAKKEAWEKLKMDMQKLNLSPQEQELIIKDIQHKEAQINRSTRGKLNIREFASEAIIGKGAFGEVRLVRHKKTGEILAMKKMKKTEMIAKNQVAHVKAEKDVLSQAKSPWVVDLKYSFQDDRYLYLVMEYLPGGDLMTLLIRKEILTEEESRFYISEIIMAVDSVHHLNYIHRDLKPDNVLLDKLGHVKLSDFGLCKHAQRGVSEGYAKIQEEHSSLGGKFSLERKAGGYKRSRQLAYSTVGTPDYIAPEVFGQAGYNETVDWWSVGVILFEMLVGYPPFFSDEPSITCQKIIHWKKTLSIPPDALLSPAATDLIKRLICDADRRLGKGGVNEITGHPFFEGVDWEKFRDSRAPYIPDLKGETDHTNFDAFEEDKNEPFYPPDLDEPKQRKKGVKELSFIGYTYKKDVENERISLLNALVDLQNIQEVVSRKRGEEGEERVQEVVQPPKMGHPHPRFNLQDPYNPQKELKMGMGMGGPPMKMYQKHPQPASYRAPPQSYKNPHPHGMHVDKFIIPKQQLAAKQPHPPKTAPKENLYRSSTPPPNAKS